MASARASPPTCPPSLPLASHPPPDPAVASLALLAPSGPTVFLPAAPPPSAVSPSASTCDSVLSATAFPRSTELEPAVHAAIDYGHSQRSGLCSDGLDDKRTLDALRAVPCQDYADFRRMLSLPPAKDGVPAPIPLPRTTAEAAVRGAMCLAAKRDAEARMERVPREQLVPREQCVPPRSADQLELSDDELDSMDELELDQGGTRDVTKSPQHHKVQLDNFVPDEQEEESDVSGEDAEWVHVRSEAHSANVAAEQAPFLTAAPAEAACAEIDADAEVGADGSEVEAVLPFALDPSFDYENVKLTGSRFNIAIAMEKGEFYDQVASSQARERTSPNETSTLPLPIV
ncbi:hypothetical protein AB1Y20_007750 [Prymnesium parvum]|uniref:Uncharacterized protein n=1 Tax=Prymnesium parvum TaxID=97485 RepID=A0AB34IVV3_PRYPA